METSSAARRPLRVGLLLDGFEQPAWVHAALAEIADSGVAENVLVILNMYRQVKTGVLARARRSLRNPRNLPYALYTKVDQQLYKTASDPFLPVDISRFVKECPVLRVNPRRTQFYDFFDDAVVEEIRQYDLDVAFRFGFRILKGSALEIARYGVWSIHHGNNRVNRGGPPGFWEVFEREDTTGAILQRLTEDLDGGFVIAESTSRTDFISVARNRANSHWQAAVLLARELRRLHAEGSVSGPEWLPYSNPIYRRPAPRQVATLGLKLSASLVSRKVQTAFLRKQWILAYFLRQAGGDEDNVPHALMYQFKEILPPDDRFWADPFAVSTGGRHWVFFEEASFTGPYAHISVLEIDADGRVGPAQPVLRLDHHLSYPFVFSWEGAWYMVPETLSQRSLQLFRARHFPDVWEYVGPMLTDVDLVDATIEHIDGVWWLFAGSLIPGTTDANALNLYHSSSPLGPWMPHCYNPVRLDVRGARPAGRLFRRHGTLYRPGQDGAPHYGSGVIVNRIDEITPASYRETPVARISPTWRPGLLGTHTLNAAGGLTVIDALRTIPRFPIFGVRRL